MNKETLRMQMLAGVITESQYKTKLIEMDGEYWEDEDDFDLDEAFKMSPKQHSYEDVLGIFESHEDDNILNAFQSTFPEGKPVKRNDYLKFNMKYIDDMSEEDYIKANWISITDEDVFEKAGLL